MTARVNVFKQPMPPKSTHGDGMSIQPSLCQEDDVPGGGSLPFNRKQPNLSVDNEPNVVRGHKV